MSATLTLGEPVVSSWNQRFPVVLRDGAEVEAVLYRGDTLCVSSQVGCAVRCPFCASGANGLGRSLSADELHAQVAAVRALGHDVVRVTVSGVGEPLHNPAEVLAFIESMHGAGTKVSVTTSGGTPGSLERLLSASHNGVTVSVHAGTEPVRARMVPHAPTLEALRAALGRGLAASSRSRRRKVALAYLLVADRNDAAHELDAFASFAVELGLDVHLYAMNPVPTSTERGVDRDAYERAYAQLRARGLVVRMSSAARLDANGGCGTLVALRRLRRGRELAP